GGCIRGRCRKRSRKTRARCAVRRHGYALAGVAPRRGSFLARPPRLEYTPPTMRTIVVVPTYNEANNIAPLAAALWELDLPDLAVLIVDDNSPDGTAAIAEDLARANPGRLYVLRRPGKQGLGTAYKAGFQRAIELGAEAVVQMDADFSHSPA